MLAEHLAAAVKRLCPFGKESCLLIDGCSVINDWRRDHRAFGFSVELTPSEGSDGRLTESRSKGGLATALKRGAYDDI